MFHRNPPKLKRYVFSVTVGSGPQKGDSRDSGEFMAPDDDAAAWQKAQVLLGQNKLVEDGDYLQLSGDGREIQGTEIGSSGNAHWIAARRTSGAGRQGASSLAAVTTSEGVFETRLG
jgi:hypothetical protein